MNSRIEQISSPLIWSAYWPGHQMTGSPVCAALLVAEMVKCGARGACTKQQAAGWMNRLTQGSQINDVTDGPGKNAVN